MDGLLGWRTDVLMDPMYQWDGFRSAVMARPHQGLHAGVGDIPILTLRIGTGIPLRVDAFGCAAAAFDFALGAQEWRGRWSGVRRAHRVATCGTVFWGARAQRAWRLGRGLFCSSLSRRCESEQSLEVSEADQDKADEYEQGEDCGSMRHPYSSAQELCGEEQG
jgi:hypothetical protein